MKKFFYRIKNIPELKGIAGQRIQGHKITKTWRQFDKRLDVKNFVDSIEEKIEDMDLKNEIDLNSITKSDLFLSLIEKGFPEEELKGKIKKDLIKLYMLNEELND